MKTYTVTVNGVSYEVTVEEKGASSPVNVQNTEKAPAPTPAPAAAPAAPSGAVTVKAPMPGTIVKLLKKTGDSVKSGDVLCVLEAMKMENDIVAPQDGTIASVHVSQGASVKSDEILFSLN